MWQTIARLDEKTMEWKKIGELVTARYSHGVIFDGESFLVIGGQIGGDSGRTSKESNGCKLLLSFHFQLKMSTANLLTTR